MREGGREWTGEKEWTTHISHLGLPILGLPALTQPGKYDPTWKDLLMDQPPTKLWKAGQPSASSLGVQPRATPYPMASSLGLWFQACHGEASDPSKSPASPSEVWFEKAMILGNELLQPWEGLLFLCRVLQR